MQGSNELVKVSISHAT